MSSVLPTFEQLMAAADGAALRAPVAAAGGADATLLLALREAHDRGWVAPIVVGRRDEIEEAARRVSVGLDGFNLVDTEEPAGAAVAEVKAGRAKLLMKGQVTSSTLLRAMLDPEFGVRTARVICQVVLMHVRRDERRFLLADTGICVEPTLEQKKDILHSAVELARALGVHAPKVALMAASETVTPSMPETVDAAGLARSIHAQHDVDCVVQGPLSFDLAYTADAAARKGLGGPVTGRADVMLFPNLLAANLTVKAIMYTAECEFGGVLMGAACPVAFMSRADDAPTRLRSLALALRLLSQS